MILTTWNIQCGKGIDGRVDLDRIVDVLTEDGTPDVICLQEVARDMPEPGGGAGADQPAELARRLPGFVPAFGAAIDRRGRRGARAQFGNLVLSRLPIVQIFQHLLPQPAEAGVLHMPRQATEAVVTGPFGPIRIVTTHLEFHSERQRLAQVERLRELHREVSENHRHPPAPAAEDSPYERTPRPETTLLCGDFNARPGDEVYRQLLASFPDPVPPFRDAWHVLHGDAAHAPTCGVHDREQWPEGPHARDYVMVTPDLAGRIDALEVNTGTAASDHQPVRVVIRDRRSLSSPA